MKPSKITAPEKRLLLLALACLLLLCLCACRKEKDEAPGPLPDLHDYVRGLDTIGEGDSAIVLHEADAEAFLKDAGFRDMSGIQQAVLYTSDKGPERLLAVEFTNENTCKEGYKTLMEKLGVIKDRENCSGNIDEFESNCALLFYTYNYSVDAKLWENEIIMSWLQLLQSLD